MYILEMAAHSSSKINNQYVFCQQLQVLKIGITILLYTFSAARQYNGKAQRER